jgi:hypothetical protein
MKNLPERVREKAIEIANAVVEDQPEYLLPPCLKQRLVLVT